MTSARQPEPTLTSGNEMTNVDDITRRDTRHERSVGSNEKSNEVEDPLESDMSDLETPKGFKEGGYGWYVKLEHVQRWP